MPFANDQLTALLDEARTTNTSALVLLHNGQPLVNEILDGQGDRPIETMSVTKAIVSLLVGRALTLGLLPSTDVAVSELYPEWRQGQKRDITLRHLMTHTSGLQNTPDAGTEIYPSPDFVQLALSAELEHAPGSMFSYNNKAVNLILGLLEQATGRKADEFAREELFTPLGIQDWGWDRDTAGNPHGMSGLRLRPLDLARLGELARNDGAFEQTVLIDPAWMRLSTQPATRLTESIGLLWWTLPAWTHYEITPEHVQAVQEAGGTDEQVRALAETVGTFSTQGSLVARMNVTGLVPPALPKGTKWVAVRTGPLVGFRHDGSLGQHLVVNREARLVAVRLVDWQRPHAQADATRFTAFVDRILEL